MKGSRVPFGGKPKSQEDVLGRSQGRALQSIWGALDSFPLPFQTHLTFLTLLAAIQGWPVRASAAGLQCECRGCEDVRRGSRGGGLWVVGPGEYNLNSDLAKRIRT